MKNFNIFPAIVSFVALFGLLLVKPSYAYAGILADSELASQYQLVKTVSDADEKSLRLASEATVEEHLLLSAFYRAPVEKDSFYGISTRFTFYHRGIDYRAKMNSPVYPVQAGVVKVVAYESGGYGRNVIIEHENGVESLYAHLSKTFVEVGDSVDPSMEIGQIGMTGRTTGPHLHFELRVNGKQINPADIIPEVN